MRLLFTSYKGFYFLNTDKGVVHPIHEGSGMYYGLTWFNNIIYVAARNSVTDYRLGNEKILMFNKDLKFIGEMAYRFEDYGLHSILVDPISERLWATGALRNCVAMLDLKITEKKHFWPNKVKNSDRNHFNSLTYQNGKMLLNAHNNGLDCGEIYICKSGKHPKVESIERIPGTTHTHCCFYLDGELATCASEQSQITTVNGNILPRKLKGYTRGIVLTQDKLVVGESQRAVREDRVNSDGIIHIYDRKSVEKIEKFNMKNIGQVAEIRCLDEHDEHHWPDPMYLK